MRLIFWIGVGAAAALFLTVIEMSRRDALDRQSFFIWASISIGLAVVSLLPNILRYFTNLLGMDYTYVFTFTGGILGLLALNIYTLAKVSRNRRDLNDLSQEVSLDNLKEP